MATASKTTVRDLGNLQRLPKEEKTFLTKGLKNRSLFPALPEPDEDDWLSSHSEMKETHDSWWQRFQSVISPVRERKKKIYLVPLGEKWATSEVELDKIGTKESFLSLLQRFASVFFTGFQVVVLSSVSIAELKCKTRRHGGHRQLLIPDIYKYLQSKWPSDAFCVVGITMMDLYPRESWNYVFGQALPSAGVGVFSFARYDPLFHEKDSTKALSSNTSTLVLWRSCKVMAHEICHLFALKHCVFFSCAMNGSNHLQESNNRPMFSCPICLHKLKSWFGFNMKERYQALLEFCSSVEDENFQGATIWLQKAIKELS